MRSNKIVQYDDRAVIERMKEGKRVVLIGGCFDILHYGHIRFMIQAKEKGDLLIIALESDVFIKEIKKKDPTHTQIQRAEILAHLDFVDMIILLPLFVEKNYFELVQMVRPCVIALTEGDPHRAEKSVQALKVGAEIVKIDFIKGYSSSQIQQYGPLSRD